jgi:hypothetical protein
LGLFAAFIDALFSDAARVIRSAIIVNCVRRSVWKRTDANADRDAIVKEFAAAWLPHLAVEQEVLAPALNQAGIDEEKLAAGAIQKDIVNFLLADLLRDDSREFG